jgi:hypothetical protein
VRLAAPVAAPVPTHAPTVLFETAGNGRRPARVVWNGGERMGLAYAGA